MDDAPFPVFGFTQIEIMKMESLFEEFGEQTLGEDFCQDIATRFSSSSGASKNMFVRWEEVQRWFQNKHKGFDVPCSPGASEGLDVLSKASTSNSAPQNSLVPRGNRAADLSELTFEAKSSKDDAWYDVASFLTYRVLSNGELEARVRFSGFRNEEDEWVNVKKGIRDRSIPLEPSECFRVKVGDLVLCFQERSEQAVYCDAHVIEIQRRVHDIRACKCIFLVRYKHDNSEEKVNLKRLCCRPTQ